MRWKRSSSAIGQPMRKSTGPASYTGDTREVMLARITLPPKAMGENGRILIEGRVSFTNSSNRKIVNVRFAGVPYLTAALVNSSWWRFEVKVRNKGSADVQEGSGFGLLSTGALVRAVDGPRSSAADTREKVDITITGQLSSPEEKITLEICQVIVHPK